MISVKQLYDGLVSGTITIDENGHDPFYGWGPDSMLERLRGDMEFWDSRPELYKTGNKWSDAIIGVSVYRDTDKHIAQFQSDSPCSKCGENLGWIYNHDESKIVCVVRELNKSDKGMDSWFYEYYTERCKHEKNLPQVFDFEVKEKIIFANFFRDAMAVLDNDKSIKKYPDYSLNHEAGIKRVCEYHAKNNIGFQQTGNSSVDIYLSNDETEILVLEDKYYCDELDENGNEYIAKKELPKLGYKYCGNVSCDMWRYMFANVSDVKRGKNIGGKSVRLSPQKGIYTVSNYLETNEHDYHKISKFSIASRIKLKV